MRRIGTSVIATVGLASIIAVGGSLAPVSATPESGSSDEATPSPVIGTPTPEPTSDPTADEMADTMAPPPEDLAPAPSADDGSSERPAKTVTQRRRRDEAGPKTLADIRAGRAVLVLGDEGDAVSAVQKRLNAAGITTPQSGIYTRDTQKAVRRLQWKYLMSQTGDVNRQTYRRLERVTRGRMVPPRACRDRRQKRIICVDLKQRVLRYVKRGKATFTIDIRSGLPRTRTRKGSFRVFDKYTYWYSTLYNVGMPYTMFFSGGQAFHYSMAFDAVGYNGGSGGCVNIGSLAQARWLYRNTPIGTRVRVY